MTFSGHFPCYTHIMIINSGMRTDIPAFYSEWFLNRIREGKVLVRNPYYGDQVTEYDLTPDKVDLLIFCTKDPTPMLKHIDELKDFNQFWFVTITPYGKDVEPFVPDKQHILDSFMELSRKVGIKNISWRYDPILITDKYSLEYHKEAFDMMAYELKGYTDNVVISFLDLYNKTIRNFDKAREVTFAERDFIGEHFAKIGKDYGITVRTCLEGTELGKFGIETDGCMTKRILEKAIGCSLNPPSEKNPRRECDCLTGRDIGAYNTCPHLCRYCYANYDKETVRRNVRLHDPGSPLLIGNIRPEDTIKKAQQNSFITGQIMLDI